mmetsp:Transcript_148776/g.274721  ORF Transcript_148776/g.274721 Transcript_148776/m.274721 type:complete len:697 (+) Transcript_148776:62-2152(+)
MLVNNDLEELTSELGDEQLTQFTDEDIKLDASTYGGFLALLLYFDQFRDQFKQNLCSMVGLICLSGLMLMVTMVIQIMILVFISSGQQEMVKEFEDKLLSSADALCWHADSSVLNFLPAEVQASVRPVFDKSGELLSCVPDEILLMYSLPNLAHSVDGEITFKEVVKLQSRYTEETGRNSSIFSAYMRAGNYLNDLSSKNDLEATIKDATWWSTNVLSQDCTGNGGGFSDCATTTPSLPFWTTQTTTLPTTAETAWTGPYYHDGQPYWYNEQTDISTWTQPLAFKPPAFTTTPKSTIAPPWFAQDPSATPAPKAALSAAPVTEQDIHMKYVNIAGSLYNMEIFSFLDTCILLDSRLCANKLCEKRRQRGDLRKYFAALPFDDVPVGVRAFDYKPYTPVGEATHKDPIFRDYFQVCQDISDVCPRMMSQQYSAWKQSRDEICEVAKIQIKTSKTAYKNHVGEPIVGANEKVPYAEFKKWEEFNQDLTGVKRMTFRIFFYSILALWFVVSWYQLHERLAFIAMLTSLPTWASQDQELQPIPTWAFALYMIFSGVPEVLITIAVAILGALFLMTTSKYMDLVMNSLALAFVVEVDDLLYMAFATNHMKGWLDSIKIKGIKEITPTSRFGVKTVTWHQVVLMLVIITAACICGLYKAKWAENSQARVAEALTCLCQAEGPTCLVNLMLKNFTKESENFCE